MYIVTATVINRAGKIIGLVERQYNDSTPFDDARANLSHYAFQLKGAKRVTYTSARISLADAEKIREYEAARSHYAERVSDLTN